MSTNTDLASRLARLSVDPETLALMAHVLVGRGGNSDRTSERSVKISAMLQSGAGGFLDRAKYPVR